MGYKAGQQAPGFHVYYPESPSGNDLSGKLEVELSDKEISERLNQLAKFEPKIKSGYLKYYVENVGSASTGAVFI